MSASSGIADGDRGDLVFIGDAHLDRDDPDLEPFLRFLDRLAETSRRIVFLGDLFNLWIGRRELEQPHQTAVVEKLVELRRRGVVVRYIEGNRDYRIGPCYAGHAVDDATSEAIVETFAGRRLVVVHGDQSNPADLQYRTWRAFSRSAAVWHLFNLIPRGRRIRLSESLELRLRGSNLRFKQAFPEQAVRAYAATMLKAPGDILVLGHFHVEKDLHVGPPGPEGRIMVLPEWKASRRHLRVGWDGVVEFVDSEV